jgi:hypothetical protein
MTTGQNQMTKFTVTIERVTDNRRFRKVISAPSAEIAMQIAQSEINAAADDYYIINWH